MELALSPDETTATHSRVRSGRTHPTARIGSAALRSLTLFREERRQVANLVENRHELRDLAIQRDSDAENRREARHLASSLHVADVALCEARCDRELLLRHPVLLPQLPQAASEHFAFRLNKCRHAENTLLFGGSEITL